MTGYVRRIVTGHDSIGKAVVLEDGVAPAVHQNPHRPGRYITQVWVRDTLPARITAQEPDPTARPLVLAPPNDGVALRVIGMPPETTTEVSAKAAAETFADMGADKASTFGKTARHAFMHRTETEDYAIVLAGEVVLVLDEEEVTMKAGDIAIQRGTNHSWANRSSEPCRVAFVMLGGRYAPELKAALTSAGDGAH